MSIPTVNAIPRLRPAVGVRAGVVRMGGGASPTPESAVRVWNGTEWVPLVGPPG